MQKDTYRQEFRGGSYKDQDLTGVDFSHADIRGADFSGATLIGAKFIGVKAGLQFRWTIIINLCCLIVSVLSGVISSFAFIFVRLCLFPGGTFSIQGACLSIVSLLYLIYFPLRVGRANTNLELTIGGLILISTTVLIVAYPTTPVEIAAFIVFQVFAIIGILTAATIGALVWAVSISTIEALSIFIGFIGFFVGSLTGFVLGINVGKTPPNILHITQIVNGVLSLCLFFYGLYLGKMVLVEDEKYKLLRTVAIFLCSLKGTCFRNADLTDANFSHASLKHTDLRTEKLTRTFWRNAKRLNQALVLGTYLESPKIRELVIKGKSKDKEFQHLVLQGLNLQSADLRGVDFMGSNLSEANLREADLSNSNLKQTQFYGAYLSFSTLTGACIEDWGISPTTLLEEIKCDYVFMRQATEDKPDRWRKPDYWQEFFPEGGFSTFIAPIITTLDAYNPQSRDLSDLDHSFKPLDLYHYDGVDPAAVVVAIKQLQNEYPEAELEIVALYGPSKNKLRIEARVADDADAAKLNAKYQDKYQRNQQSPSSDIQTLLARIEEEDPQALLVRKGLENSDNSVKFLTVIQHVENFHGVGDRMSEIKVDSGGGTVSGIVGGDIRDVSGIANLGEISGDVTNSLGSLPDSQSDEPGLKERLIELQAAIESDQALSPEDKAEALEQVKLLAEAGKKPEDGVLKRTAKTAVKVLKGTVSELPDAAKLAEACSKLLPIILKLLGLD